VKSRGQSVAKRIEALQAGLDEAARLERVRLIQAAEPVHTAPEATALFHEAIMADHHPSDDLPPGRYWEEPPPHPDLAELWPYLPAFRRFWRSQPDSSRFKTEGEKGVELLEVMEAMDDAVAQQKAPG